IETDLFVFSSVYLASNNLLPGIKLACKVFQHKAIDKLWREEYLTKEMIIMTKLRHKNICWAYDVYKMRSGSYIFMKYAQNGTLDSWMEKNGGRMSEQQTKKYFFGLMSGLDYLHRHNIAHR